MISFRKQDEAKAQKNTGTQHGPYGSRKFAFFCLV